MISSSTPAVTVIVPCCNEAAHIRSALDSMLGQEVPEGGFEIIIADGMSTDGTREVIQAYVREHPELRVIDNPRKFVSPGLNLAIQAARGDVIIRMDMHTEYAPDYIRQSVRILKETGAQNVGGPARTRSQGYLQNAIRLAYHSPFSCGGAAFHNPDHEGYVDTVTYGCWKKDTLLSLGLFDEELIRNQDDELNLRLVRAGGQIWQSPAIQSWYYPRASLRALFRQYAQYGYWKVRVIQKHKIPASWRHLIPGTFVASLVLLSLLAPVGVLFWWLWLGLVISYASAVGAASLLTCRSLDKLRFLPVMPIVFTAYHIGYGYGFLRGLIDFVILRKGCAASFKELTRSKPASTPGR